MTYKRKSELLEWRLRKINALLADDWDGHKEAVIDLLNAPIEEKKGDV